MTMDVHEQLDRLAQRAPIGDPPPDLWRRGVRLRRRRAATAVGATLTVALVVALGAGTAGSAWNRLDSTGPTATTAPPAMPTRMQAPSPWTPGTDRAGAPGRLAVVAGAARRTGILGTERDGLVAISAETGRYRFLDLPGSLSDSSGLLFNDTPVSLSPTGRYVAYWRGGLAPVGARYGEVAVGVAVYDAVTGKVRRSEIPTRRGLTPGPLVWVDDDTVAVAYDTITDRDASTLAAAQAPLRFWSLSSGGLSSAPGLRALRPSDGLAPTPSGFSSWDDSRLTLWSGTGTTYQQQVLRIRGLGRDESQGSHLVAPDGRRVALVPVGARTSQSRLYVATVPRSGATLQVRPVDVPGWERGGVQSVVGWRDPTHVLVEAVVGRTAGVYAVDVGTGAATRSVAYPDQSYTPGRVYASALWHTAPVPRPGPARAHDPRLLAAGGGLVGLVVVGGILAMRRRRALL